MARGFFQEIIKKRLQDSLGFPRPFLEVPTATPIRKGLSLHRRTGIKKGTEVKEIHPVVDIAQEIASYARKVASRGEQPVTIVDFGAGAAVTISKVARLLKEDIKAGRVRVIATNIDAAPTEEDIRVIKLRYPHEHGKNVVEALTEKTVIYAKADILELYELLKGDPVHLLFMIDMLPFTEDYNAALLKITGEMLHSRLGTAVFSFDKTHLTDRYHVIRQGLDDLIQKGFRSVHPLQVAKGTLRPWSAYEHRFEMYQGNDALTFPMYTV